MRNGVRKERKEDEERIIELQLKGMQKWARDKREIERRDGMWRSLTHCVILGWDPMTKWKATLVTYYSTRLFCIQFISDICCDRCSKGQTLCFCYLSRSF